jgi:UPF0148 protein
MASTKDEGIKKAADLLRQGATMLGDSCPVCGMPLFKLKSGEVVCPQHGRVYVVKDEEEERRVRRRAELIEAQDLLITNAFRLVKKLEREPEEAEVLVQVLRYFEAIERVSRLLREEERQRQ